MVKRLNAQINCILIRKRPTNVIVYADVIDPRAMRWQVKTFTHGVLQHAHIASRQCFPKQSHKCGVVGQLRLVDIDVLDDVIGVDDGFRFERQCGRCDFGGGIENTHQLMGLWQVFTGRTQLFPDESDRIQTQHLNALIGKK